MRRYGSVMGGVTQWVPAQLAAPHAAGQVGGGGADVAQGSGPLRLAGGQGGGLGGAGAQEVEPVQDGVVGGAGSRRERRWVAAVLLGGAQAETIIGQRGQPPRPGRPLIT